MKQDKFLTGILIGVGALVILALVLFFTRQDKRDYLADDTPEGVAHNYVLAVINKDYEKAYGYLADLKYKPTYEEFRQSFLNGMVNPDGAGIDIGEATINGDEAVVDLTLYYSYSDPFSSRTAAQTALYWWNKAASGRSARCHIPSGISIGIRSRISRNPTPAPPRYNGEGVWR